MRRATINKRTKLVWLCAITCALLTVCLAGCAPISSDQSQQSDEPEGGSTSSISWSMDSDCSVCHADQKSPLSDSNCLGGKHADVSCTSCHTDESGLSKIHEGAADAYKGTKLKKTEISEDACLSCHGSWEELAQKTTGVTTLTDSKGTTVNPHTVKDQTLNADGNHDDITCASCHTVHTQSDSTINAQNTCLSCHHQNVYECGTCHAR